MRILGDPAVYGIDWDVANDVPLMRHLLDNNPQEWEDNNPFATQPSTLSHVPRDPPDAPFALGALDLLMVHLQGRVDLTSRSMAVRRLIWQEAILFCRDLYSNMI